MILLDTPHKYHRNRPITLEDIEISNSLFFFQPHSRAAKVLMVYFSLERPKYAPLSSPNSIGKGFPYQMPIESDAGIWYLMSVPPFELFDVDWWVFRFKSPEWQLGMFLMCLQVSESLNRFESSKTWFFVKSLWDY